MRRMDLHPDRKLRGRARHERATLAALTRLGAWFPDRADWARPYVNVKLPAYDKVISQRHGRREFRAAVVRHLVGCAAAVAENRPRDVQARVAAIIGWPDLWPSEICVFFNADHAIGWAPEQRALQVLPARKDYDGGWIEAFVPASSLMMECGVDMPAGFAAHGTGLREYDSESDLTFEREEWVVMEIAGPERAISKGMCHDQV